MEGRSDSGTRLEVLVFLFLSVFYSGPKSVPARRSHTHRQWSQTEPTNPDHRLPALACDATKSRITAIAIWASLILRFTFHLIWVSMTAAQSDSQCDVHTAASGWETFSLRRNEHWRGMAKNFLYQERTFLWKKVGEERGGCRLALKQP